MSSNNIEIKRHSYSHILAMAVLRLFPGAKLGIGPAIENGFYYDFGNLKISLEDLPKIQKEMQKLIKNNIEFEKKDISRQQAEKIFADQQYKLELIKELVDEKISIYKTGDLVDLCKGPHVNSSKELGSDTFKLTKVAGAYWRGDEKNPMLTRIYGVAFETKDKLEKYLTMQEEAEKRDHRKLGQEMNLFMFDDEVGQGLPLWMPKGALLRHEIEQFVLREYIKKGYQLVRTPNIASGKLFEQSGHLGFYKDGMYSPMDIDGEDYYVKPMNCPFHVKIYNNGLKSYRNLPIRYTELGTVYRYEKSGTLHGLTRVRGFTQDDAHIICTAKQLTNELVDVIDLTKYILESFGFSKFKVVLSVRDPNNKDKFLGTDDDWDIAENGLKKALEIAKWDYSIEEGEAVFYGPKIDVKIYDAMNREWQISTIQLDFNLPGRFKMRYIGENGKEETPFMIHRALLGSLERFTGILIEHYAGAFPLWLSPIQVKIISVGESHIEFCKKLADEFKMQDIRIEIDDSDETVGKKIRKARTEKIPYILVIGDKEMESDNLHINVRGQKEIVEMGKEKFINKIREEIKNKE